MKTVNLSISQPVLEHIAVLLQGSDVEDPIPALLLGKRPDEERERWSLGLYTRAHANRLEQMYQSRGLHALVSASGIQLCIPQTHLHSQLEGKILDVLNRELIVQ